MSKLISFKDSNGIPHRLTLQDGDLAVLERLRHKQTGDVPLSITAVSAHGDLIMATQKNRIYEVPRKSIFG